MYVQKNETLYLMQQIVHKKIFSWFGDIIISHIQFKFQYLFININLHVAQTKKRTLYGPFFISAFAKISFALFLLGDADKIHFRIPEGFFGKLVFKFTEKVVHFFKFLLVCTVVWILVAKVFEIVSAV